MSSSSTFAASTSTANVTVTTLGGGSITCVFNGNVITVTSTTNPSVSEVVEIPSPPAPARIVQATLPLSSSEVVETVNVDSEDDDEGDWETEDDESVVSEDDRDPVLACLKRRRLAAIEKAEKEVVARDALDLGSAECLICLSNPRTVAVVPCGHIISCDPCSKKLSDMNKHADGFSSVDGTKCPTCRGDVKHLLRLYA